MLIQFKFENYKSFRDETVLNLTSTKITEHSERIVKIGNIKTLPLAAIYGANASGKSNIYSAFHCMTNLVLKSFQPGNDKGFCSKKPTPFLFDDYSVNKDVYFEIFFNIPGDEKEKTYDYGFCLNDDGFTQEWLKYKSKTGHQYKLIFSRDKDHLDMPGISNEDQKLIEIPLKKYTLIISLGAILNIDICKKVRDWFANNQFANFGNAYSDFILSSSLPKDFVEDEQVRKNVIKFFSSFDESIVDFIVNKVPIKNESEEDNYYYIKTIHKSNNSDDTIAIPLKDESDGTLKMFALYSHLYEALKKGSILFIDELDARLHPLLVRSILLSFLNPDINTQHSQIIFTTHDTWQLTNDLLRRDEIWFTEKDNQEVSSLYSLADFVDEDGTSIRKDENYQKNYLLGKYGAIPFLKGFDF